MNLNKIVEIAFIAVYTLALVVLGLDCFVWRAV